MRRLCKLLCKYHVTFKHVTGAVNYPWDFLIGNDELRLPALNDEFIGANGGAVPVPGRFDCQVQLNLQDWPRVVNETLQNMVSIE